MFVCLVLVPFFVAIIGVGIYAAYKLVIHYNHLGHLYNYNEAILYNWIWFINWHFIVFRKRVCCFAPKPPIISNTIGNTGSVGKECTTSEEGYLEPIRMPPGAHPLVNLATTRQQERFVTSNNHGRVVESGVYETLDDYEMYYSVPRRSRMYDDARAAPVHNNRYPVFPTGYEIPRHLLTRWWSPAT